MITLKDVKKTINIYTHKKYKIDLLLVYYDNRINLVIFYENSFKFKTSNELIKFKDINNIKLYDYYIYKYILYLYNNLLSYGTDSHVYNFYLVKYYIWLNEKNIEFDFTGITVKLNYKEIIKLRINLNNILYNYRKY